jgi:hypothetical protein
LVLIGSNSTKFSYANSDAKLEGSRVMFFYSKKGKAEPTTYCNVQHALRFVVCLYPLGGFSSAWITIV